MQLNKSSRFGPEVERDFPVAEECYDCVEFCDGCNAWPENRPFRCADYYPLPDVKPGTSGQVFPPSRMQGRREPRVRREAAADGQGGSLDPSAVPTSQKLAGSRAGPRLCGCGAALPKNKQFCEFCRVQRRRLTMREYMRGRRAAQRRSEDTSDLPLFAAARPSRRASGGDLLQKELPSGGADSEQTSV
jgi:hypothetical protein